MRHFSLVCVIVAAGLGWGGTAEAVAVCEASGNCSCELAAGTARHTEAPAAPWRGYGVGLLGLGVALTAALSARGGSRRSM